MTEGELFGILPALLKRHSNSEQLGSHFYHQAVQDALKADDPEAELERIIAAATSKSAGSKF